MNVFPNILDDSKRKPNKVWVDKGSEFFNMSLKTCQMTMSQRCIQHKEKEKSVVAGTFVRTLTHKIYKHMAAMSKNVYFDMINDFVDKYNNTYHRVIKMKPIDVKCSSRAITPPIWSEEVLVFSKVKNTVTQIYVISDLNGEEINGKFYEKELRKINRTKF